MGVVKMTEATPHLIEMWCSLKGAGIQGLIGLIAIVGVVIFRKWILKIWRKPKKRGDR